MFLFTIAAKPGPEIEEVDNDVGGAYVNVWVNFPEEGAAEVVARFYIKNAGWVPELTTETSWVVEKDYEEDDDYREYYLEAMRDGSCLVFHQWPKDAEDSDVDYETNEQA